MSMHICKHVMNLNNSEFKIGPNRSGGRVKRKKASGIYKDFRTSPHVLN